MAGGRTKKIFECRGGGVCLATRDAAVESCAISNNRAASTGAGVFNAGGALRNCVIAGNYSTSPGGVWGGVGVHVQDAAPVDIQNCVIMRNMPASGSYAAVHFFGGNGSSIFNSVVYYNSPANINSNGYSVTISHVCTKPMPAGGAGNITNEPGFIDQGGGCGLTFTNGNYRLRRASPCLNAGTNRPWMHGGVDRDGCPRIRMRTVDIGAYEYIPRGTVFFAE